MRLFVTISDAIWDLAVSQSTSTVGQKILWRKKCVRWHLKSLNLNVFVTCTSILTIFFCFFYGWIPANKQSKETLKQCCILSGEKVYTDATFVDIFLMVQWQTKSVKSSISSNTEDCLKLLFLSHLRCLYSSKILNLMMLLSQNLNAVFL